MRALLIFPEGQKPEFSKRETCGQEYQAHAEPGNIQRDGFMWAESQPTWRMAETQHYVARGLMLLRMATEGLAWQFRISIGWQGRCIVAAYTLLQGLIVMVKPYSSAVSLWRYRSSAQQPLRSVSYPLP